MELYLLTIILLVLMDLGIMKIEARFDITKRNVMTKGNNDDTCHKQLAILSHEDLSKTCGLQHPDKSLGIRIVNGYKAEPGQFPFAVKISNSTNGIHMCGGSLINNKYILTAAHCITKKTTRILLNTDDLTIELGAYFFNSSSSDCRIEYKAKEFYIHNGFLNPHLRDDIGIIELEEPIIFEYYQGGYGSRGPICLANDAENLVGVGQELSVAGWGATSIFIHVPELLNFDTYQVSDRSNCPNSYNNEICMEGGNTYKSFNFGDSGSALFTTNDNQSYLQVGIASRFDECQEVHQGKHGELIKICSNMIYTRVDSHLKWIESIIARKPMRQ